MDENKYIAFCQFCEWKSISKYDDILRDKLENHLEEQHGGIIMEVWMNNQASNCIVDFKQKDLKCFNCNSIMALCDCSNPKFWKCYDCKEELSPFDVQNNKEPYRCLSCRIENVNKLEKEKIKNVEM